MNRVAQDFKLSSGRLGNGTTVWNSLREVNRDYEMVAHISEDGKTISWRIKNLPKDIVSQVEAIAKSNIKPAEILNDESLPEGFDITTCVFEGFQYVACDPRFQNGRNIWLRQERITASL